MSTLATAPGVELREHFALHDTEHEEPTVSDGGRLTLSMKLDSVWEGLLAAGAAGCPVCGARMERRAGAGCCGSCGSSLS